MTRRPASNPQRKQANDTPPAEFETLTADTRDAPAPAGLTADEPAVTDKPAGDEPGDVAPVEENLTSGPSTVLGDVAGKELEPAGGKTDDGRPRCRVPECIRPEVTDNAGLCGAHWSLRPDLRRGARHGDDD
jgi:hypothetical protein